MLNYRPDVDTLLHALGEPTRRRIVDRLGDGPLTVKQIAEPLPMSLPAVVQHLHVLEGSGLISTSKSGRVRTCRLEADGLNAIGEWVAARKRSWERRLDRLGDVLAADSKELAR